MKGIHNIHKMTASIAAVLLSASLFSCSSDDFFGKADGTSEGISFGVTDAAETRAANANDAQTVAHYVLRSDASADTLCVRAIVTDGIGNDDNKPMTRAAMQTTMYDKFNVVAAYKEDGNIGSQFFMNEIATKNGTNWVPERIYYWPGSNRQLRFLAWAPTDATFQAVPNSPTATTLQYTTPAEAKDQRDIVAAATDFIDSPAKEGNCIPVGLQFKHLCTAVKIKTGAQMTAGTIKSVSITNVKNSGSYNMVSSTWSLNDGTANYTVTPNKATTGTTPNGTDLNAGESTLMLLPQTLGADSELKVEFHDNISGRDRTLSASLNGAEWPMGKTVTYRLSITSDCVLEFSSAPTEVDAHYDIIPIKINTIDVPGNWTIKSNQPWATLKSALTTYEESGYWLKATGDYKDYCKSEKVPVERMQTLEKTGNGETTLYMFVEENNSTADRNVSLTLTKNGIDVTTVNIVQKCPNWQGDIGWEVLEDDKIFPFGFKWDRKVTYQKNNLGWASAEAWWIKQNFKKQPKNFWEWIKFVFVPETVPYVTVSYSGRTVTFTVDYSKMAEITATSEDNGLDNTWNLYSLVGGTSFEGEKYIANRGYTITSQSGSNDIPKVFAALYAVKLNAFEVHKGNNATGTETTYAITPEKTDIKWYLPASNQFSGAVGLNGQHWSSTGIQDNTNAYTWDASPQSTPRMEQHKVRAVRMKE